MLSVAGSAPQLRDISSLRYIRACRRPAVRFPDRYHRPGLLVCTELGPQPNHPAFRVRQLIPALPQPVSAVAPTIVCIPTPQLRGSSTIPAPVHKVHELGLHWEGVFRPFSIRSARPEYFSLPVGLCRGNGGRCLNPGRDLSLCDIPRWPRRSAFGLPGRLQDRRGAPDRKGPIRPLCGIPSPHLASPMFGAARWPDTGGTSHYP